jgi:hypothetical protein
MSLSQTEYGRCKRESRPDPGFAVVLRPKPRPLLDYGDWGIYTVTSARPVEGDWTAAILAA